MAEQTREEALALLREAAALAGAVVAAARALVLCPECDVRALACGHGDELGAALDALGQANAG